VTLGERGAARTNGFDYLRIGLAIAVVCFHAYALNEGSLQGMPWAFQLGGKLIMPMFFALSGFLVAGSLVRVSSLVEFVALRVFRLVPALAVEILLSALILGPLLSAFPVRRYFADPAFAVYFQNIYGSIHFALPGLFLHNPVGGVVNGSLWTIPFELACYVILVALVVLGITRWARLFALLVFTAAIVIPMGVWLTGDPLLFGSVQGRVLVFSFLAGVALFFLRDRVPFHRGVALAAAVVTVAGFAFPQWSYFAVFSVAYLTVWLGLQNLPAAPGGDYSYGLYLFAFPLQQAIWQLVPIRAWWMNLALALPLGLAYAAFSWHCVEKPVLARKRALIALLTSQRTAWFAARE
jgi:peptidoglycan/LPS O-acetylase OafA/YrhL